METMAISPEREERRRRQKEWSVPVFVVGCLGCQFVDVSVS